VQQTPKVVAVGALPFSGFINLATVYNQIYGYLPDVGLDMGYEVTCIKLDNGQIFEFGPQKIELDFL
jgi:hypothetical protein